MNNNKPKNMLIVDRLRDDITINSNNMGSFSGMPLRTQDIIQDINIKQNNNIKDLCIFRDTIKTSDKKSDKILDSYVESQDNYNNLANISNVTKTLTTDINNYEINNISKIGLFFLNNLSNIIKIPFTVNPLGIYIIFAVLYIASDGNSEIEIKKYFDFSKRESLFNNLNNILTNLKNISDYIKFTNIILFSKDLNHDSKFIELMKNLVIFKTIDQQNIKQECNSINKFINKTLDSSMKNMVTCDNLTNMSIILLNSMSITPIWKYKFLISNKIMYVNNQTFGYYKDKNIEMLEIPSIDNKLIFGIITNNIPKLTLDILNTYISNIKPKQFSQVIIPIFKTQTKLRYNNFLKTSNMNTVFIDLNISKFITDKCNIDDVIQNIEINITSSHNSTNNFELNKNSNIFNMIDKTFVYYLRQNNSIFIYGYYCAKI